MQAAEDRCWTLCLIKKQKKSKTIYKLNIMNQINISAIGTFVSYLSKYIKDNKSFKNFTNEFTEATINWIKPIFLKEDETPIDKMKDLEANPDDSINQEDVKNSIIKHLRKNPNDIKLFDSLLQEIKKKDGTKNNITINQIHHGTGDNIGRDKITN